MWLEEEVIIIEKRMRDVNDWYILVGNSLSIYAKTGQLITWADTGFTGIRAGIAGSEAWPPGVRPLSLS